VSTTVDIFFAKNYIASMAVVIVLLCGGDKTTQAADIQAAKELAVSQS
jgi:putative component of toxin-antitoxin plasmid stabilization module